MHIAQNIAFVDCDFSVGMFAFLFLYFHVIRVCARI